MGALPTLEKTWQFKVNNAVAAGAGATGNLQNHQVLRSIKDQLIGFGTLPWTVAGSSDGRVNNIAPFANAGTAGMDGTDRWSSAFDVLGNEIMSGAAAGSRHGWMVLENTAIAAHYQLCIDLNQNSVKNASIIVSPSVGFTGGSVTNRPTATDEIIVGSLIITGSGVTAQHQVHAMMSTDGKCTRVVVYQGTTNLCTFFLADVPGDPVSGWTNPSVTIWQGISAGFANPASTLGMDSTAQMMGYANNLSMIMSMGGESSGGTLYQRLTDVGSVVNTLSGVHQFWPIPISSRKVGLAGRHGYLFDLWWRPSSVATDITTFPNNAATRQFVSMGELIFPWIGDATVPAVV